MKYLVFAALLAFSSYGNAAYLFRTAGYCDENFGFACGTGSGQVAGTELITFELTLWNYDETDFYLTSSPAEIQSFFFYGGGESFESYGAVSGEFKFDPNGLFGSYLTISGDYGSAYVEDYLAVFNISTVSTLALQGDTDIPWEYVAEVADRLNPVPIPAAAWLFGSALLGLIGIARRRA